MASITYASATRLFPDTDTPAVDRLDLEITDGEFLVLVGPSGSGKSTSLRMLAGLEPVDAGRILIGDTDVTHVEPRDRDIAMVFQNYALYPHMTVAENMAFSLRLAKHSKAEIDKRIAEAAAMLDLVPYLNRRPRALSGGQRQRAAMGRAVVRSPRAFLMDEPLSNLDAKLRVQTRTQIAQLQRRLGTTTVYVTHDQVEAMTMGDRVAVLADGRLHQCASPRELYRAPANTLVAGFIGSPAMNLITVPLVDGGAAVNGNTIAVDRAALASLDSGSVVFGCRPEHVEIAQADSADAVLTVQVVEELGSDAQVYGTAEINGRSEDLVVRVGWRTPPEPLDVVPIRFDREHAHFFDSGPAGRRVEVAAR